MNGLQKNNLVNRIFANQFCVNLRLPCLLLSILSALLSCSSKKQVPSIEYTLFSKATIELQVRDKPSNTVFAEVGATTNVPYDRSTPELKIGTNGTYYLDLEIDRPVLSRLSINDSGGSILVICLIILTCLPGRQVSGQKKGVDSSTPVSL